MDKIIKIDGKDMGFRATALTPRFYRHIIGRDIMKDITKLQNAFSKAAQLPKDATDEEKQEAQMSVADLETFENLAYIMAKQYDKTLPDEPEKWLDGFRMFSIYEVLPQILDLWSSNTATTAKSKNG